jgi:hypothetical protein
LIKSAPARHYTGDLVVKIGTVIITLDRTEFAELTDKFVMAKRMLTGLAPTD